MKKARLVTAGAWGEAGRDGWCNRLIQADNLAAMAALHDDPEVRGRVTLAYLDPPFATDQQYRSGSRRTATVSAARSDPLAYEDRWSPPAYLEFLRQRLVLLHGLLGDNGSVYVHIGSQMAHYVRVLLDEVFGRENFLNEIARIKCNPKNFRRRAYGNIKDTVLYYSKSGRHVWNDSREAFAAEEIPRRFPRRDTQGRRYTTTPLHAPGETAAGATGAAWKGLPPPPGRHWRCDPSELDKLEKQGRIEWSSHGVPRKKIFAADVFRLGKKRQDVWTFKDPQYPSYPTEKNLRMLETIVLASSNPGDLILDCFAGSGGALLAAELHDRRWIGIDSSPLAIRKAIGRLQQAPARRPFVLLKE
ncbi:MAG TPA: site-specific DNA-methyltransferase [Terriglobia bacterium]|nr:site-specific DNA-methyltransferase [Terriglobia bacterium]